MKTGDKFTAVINGDRCEGLITISTDGDRIWLCQNIHEGDRCQNRHGYNYSWVLNNEKDSLRNTVDPRADGLWIRDSSSVKYLFIFSQTRTSRIENHYGIKIKEA